MIRLFPKQINPKRLSTREIWNLYRWSEGLDANQFIQSVNLLYPNDKITPLDVYEALASGMYLNHFDEFKEIIQQLKNPNAH